MKLGRLQWALIVIATAALVVMAPSDNGGDTGKMARSREQSTTNSPSNASNPDKQRPKQVGRVELERLERLKARQSEKGILGDVFNPTSWYVPPPRPKYIPPPPPPPPPAPQIPVATAPPLPFTYLGRYGDTGSRIIILSKGDRVYTVAVGEVIENTYRIEKLAVGMVVMIYLPLNVEQTLRTGEAL